MATDSEPGEADSVGDWAFEMWTGPAPDADEIEGWQHSRIWTNVQLDLRAGSDDSDLHHFYKVFGFAWSKRRGNAHFRTEIHSLEKCKGIHGE